MTTAYRLLSGTHRTADGERHEPGDVVELTEEEYDSFHWKFEPVDEDETDVDAAIPDDWDALRAMAKVYDGDEIDGQSTSDAITSFLADAPDTLVIDLKHEAGLLDDA